jgi:hypothetical protein
VRRRSGVYLWRKYGQLNKRNNRTNKIPLRKVVSIYTNDQYIAGNDLSNEFDESIPVTKAESQETACDEFDNLKRARMEERKKRIQQFVQMTKN